ncbi:MAG: carbon monoxide dehydrogenase subunit G [Vicinamibacterales bacterium]
MTLDGTYTFAAPRERVWQLLMDPKVIASCVPGCEEFEPMGDDKYRVRLTAGVAAITGTFEGTVTLADQVAPQSYRLQMEGSGGPGFVNGNAVMTLREDGTGTAVDVKAEVEVGGTIARVGQRLLGSVSKMMLDRFFACMAGKVGS